MCLGKETGRIRKADHSGKKFAIGLNWEQKGKLYNVSHGRGGKCVSVKEVNSVGLDVRHRQPSD